MELIQRSIKDFLGSKSCKNFSVMNDIVCENEKGVAFDRAVALKDILKAFFSGELERSEINADLMASTIESNYALSETNDAMAEKEAKYLQRYLRCETRQPIILDDSVEVDCGNGQSVFYKPDVIFIDKASKTVESVIFRASNPTINERTGIVKEKKGNLEEWFKLWICRKIAKDYAEKNLDLKDGDLFYVSASYYFMKKTTDSKGMSLDFFDGKGGNVVKYIEECTFGVATPPSEDDQLFMSFMDQCDAGFSCSGDECKYCHASAVCNFAKAPVKAPAKEAKKRGKITPSNAQQEAIDAQEGIFELNATAGSGKTETVTERSKVIIMKDIKENGTDPVLAAHKILHLSFTEAAVSEMKARISGKLIGEGIMVSGDDIQCFTFNAFANNAIGQYYSELGYKKRPNILPADKELNIVEQLIEQNPIPNTDPSAIKFDGDIAIPVIITQVQTIFQAIKTHQIDVDNIDIDDFVSILREKGIYGKLDDTALSAILDLYKKYDEILKEECLVTFADQEPLMYKVLDMHPEYFENLGYEHIIDDEFQDSNEVQVTTLKKLSNCKCFKSLMVVGDDSQAIYAFRDTTPEYIINFEKYIEKPVKMIFLSENRRSTPEICSLANKVNDLNEDKIDKDMIAVRESGKEPIIKGFYDEKDEQRYIADQIIELVRSGVKPEDIAYLDPMKKGCLKIGNLLSEAGIPWVIKNPLNLMENSRVKGAMALADAFYQPEATLLYFNYLVAKYDGEIFNVKTVDEINQEIAEMKNQFSNIYMLDMEVQRRIFHQYLDYLTKYGDELYEYFLSLVYDNEDLPSELEYTRIFKKYGSKMQKKMEQSYEGVVLSTIHSSKGLEWPHVFVSVTNMDSEILHKDSHRKELEEKRRLLFVAITRARDELTLTGKYVAYGPKDDRTFNQFLRELYVVSGHEDDYKPIDPMEAIRDAERKEANKKKAKERYAEQKRLKDIKLIAGSKSGKGEMTEDQKREYNKLVAGAKQASIFDLPF